MRRQLGRSIIIVAPADVCHRVEKAVGDFEVLAFRSLAELDRWRNSDSRHRESIRPDFISALGEIGIDFQALSPRLLKTLEAFAHQSVVPAVEELGAYWGSRRSFYRTWGDEIHEPPSSFLRRVRTLHAARLMEEGAAPKEAALRAGFGSTDHLRRLLRRRSK